MDMKWLIHVLLILVLIGCKGTDGDDGKISVTLSATTIFTNQTFAQGCFVVNDNETSCLCYENNMIRTDANPGACQVSSDITLVAEDSTLLDVEAGGHYYCFTNNQANDCGDNLITKTLTVNDGDAGSSEAVLLPKNGDDGDDKEYTLTFDGSDGTDTAWTE
jgi:hypothetical protein